MPKPKATQQPAPLTDAQRHEARQRMMKSRTALVLDEPFFGPLSLKLELVEDLSHQTAWTDGARLGYSPRFVLDLKPHELKALIAHEVLHCANGHPWRRNARKGKRWNEACDRVINPLLRDAGFTLPQGGLFELDATHKGKSAEWVYDRLPDMPEGDDGSQGQPGGAGFGEVRDADSGTDGTDSGSDAADIQQQHTVSEADWQQAVQNAAALAKRQGKLPGSLDRFAKEATKPRVDWRAALRRFVQDLATSDYSYARPNPRYVAHGMILPSLRSHELGAIVVAVDTSGSIDDVLLAKFNAELQSITDEMKPRETHVIYCDARIQRIDTFQRGEPITMKAKGGGGTAFEPVFKHVAKMEEPPMCVVYLTDLYGSFPDKAPEVPTIWACTSDATPPFGDLIPINE